MRRADREVREFGEIVDILDKCDCLSLALRDEDEPYVIPLNFGYQTDGEKLTLYFHGAKDGRKYELMQKYPRAAFTASCAHRFAPAEVACASGFFYESVCGSGTIAFLQGEEAAQALTIVMRHYVPDKEFAFEQKHVNAVRVWKMEVDRLTGKRRLTK